MGLFPRQCFAPFRAPLTKFCTWISLKATRSSSRRRRVPHISAKNGRIERWWPGRLRRGAFDGHAQTVERTHPPWSCSVPHVTHAVCHHRTRLPRRASRRTKSKSKLFSTPYIHIAMRVAVLTRSPASRNLSLYHGMTPLRRILHLGEELTRAFMPLAFGVPMLDRYFHAMPIVHE